MKFLSVCSGIEAASLAWEPLGWEAVAFSEIEKFPSAVLAHHWPDTPNLGDMTQYNEWKLNQPIDLLVGGTPCQSFSVAGLRKGLQDPRGNLTLTFLAMAEKFKPRWVVWENVPGVLSDKTNAFGQFLAGLGELGYGFAYRVLDAQHFGVPQRRRRVFVVGCLGDWASAAKVLFEPESLCGDLTPSREKREEVAGSTPEGTHQCCFIDRAAYNQGINAQYNPIIREGGVSDALVARGPHAVLPAQNGTIPEVAHCIQTTCHDYSRADGFNMIPTPIQNATRGKSQNGLGIGEPDAAMYTLDQASQHAVAFNTYGGSKRKDRPEGGFYAESTDKSKTLDAGTGLNPTASQGGTCVATPMQVRRLTPTECERLQGFPDGHTLIPWRNKPAEECPDGPRYKALGNSMAVPVMAWIGQRIAGLHNV